MKRVLMFSVLALLCGFFFAPSVWLVQAQNRQDNNTKAGWLSDIDYTVDQIIKTHPNPFTRTSRDAFYANVNRLKLELPKLNDDEVSVRLMQIVASIRDGHTSLFPASGSDRETWFPVRFYQFTDGLFITAIDKQYAKLAGAKVVRIGDKSAAEAVGLAQSAFAADNQFAALQASDMLSSPRILRGLHISTGVDLVSLQLITRNNESVTIQLSAVKSKSGFDYQYFGEMFGPIGNLVTAFDGRAPGDFLDPDANSALALHLRGRRAFWFTYLSKEATLYLQLNAMRDRSAHTEETLHGLLERMFLFADLHPVDKFVLDLRYNSGGNGALVDGIVHEFIKRDSTLNREGHLFTIIGRKTYSAAADLATQMKRHTRTAFIGEPMGAAPNGFGDPDSTILPNSKMQLAISTSGSVGSKNRKQNLDTPVQFPAQFSSAQYFGGQDPALEIVLNAAEHADLLDVLRTNGGAAANKLYEERKKKYGTLSWWQPFDNDKLNAEGFRLMGQGRKDDGIAAFLIVVDRFPDRWEPWDSLAEGYMNAGRYPEAIAAYKKSLAINPNNFNAGFAKKSIQKMEDELRKQPQ